MSKGPGRWQREIMTLAREWKAQDPEDPDLWWFPTTAVPADTRSDVEGVRRAAQALERKGWVERRRTAPQPLWCAKSRKLSAPMISEVADGLGLSSEAVAGLLGVRATQAASWVRLVPDLDLTDS